MSHVPHLNTGHTIEVIAGARARAASDQAAAERASKLNTQAAEPAAVAAESARDLVSLSAAVLNKVKIRIQQMEIRGEDSDPEIAMFLQDNLKHLSDMTNGFCTTPEEKQVSAWLQGNNLTTSSAKSISTFTNELQNVANVFADVCEIVRTSVEAALKGKGTNLDEQVRTKAVQAINLVCRDIAREAEAAAERI